MSGFPRCTAAVVCPSLLLSYLTPSAVHPSPMLSSSAAASSASCTTRARAARGTTTWWVIDCAGMRALAAGQSTRLLPLPRLTAPLLPLGPALSPCPARRHCDAWQQRLPLPYCSASPALCHPSSCLLRASSDPPWIVACPLTAFHRPLYYRHPLQRWYETYKSVMGPFPPPYYTGPPVPTWNK